MLDFESAFLSLPNPLLLTFPCYTTMVQIRLADNYRVSRCRKIKLHLVSRSAGLFLFGMHSITSLARRQ